MLHTLALLPNFEFYLWLRINFHKSSFWVPILAAGGPYFTKNLSLGVPFSFRDSAIAQASPKERKSFLAAFVNGILFIQ